MEIIIATVGAIFGCIGGASIISGLILRRFDKFEKHLERREKDRVKEALLIQNCLVMCAELAAANNMAIREITDEDVCENELTSLKNARSELELFQRSRSVEFLHAG